MGLSYEQAGVDYGPLDAFKRACQREAATTRGALAALGAREPESARGESAYLIETDDAFLAHVEEGLGTKNLVADAMAEATGRCFYRAVGIDTVATIVNDLATCGATPVSVAMHAAVGDGAWFSDATRASELAAGFAEGCRRSGAVWGGGETPALKGLIQPGAIVLAGSAFGWVRPKSRRIAGDVRGGDAIVLVRSSGVHTNGLTLCRALAARLPRGYLTPMSDGRAFGEALLDASVIYAPLVDAVLRAGVRPHYAVHMTGHGWRKLMRLDEPFVYRITTPGEPHPVFRFLMEAGPIEPREAWATFNMGAGFALMVAPGDAAVVVAAARECGFDAWIGGEVRRDGARKAVEIAPLGLSFESETLSLR